MPTIKYNFIKIAQVGDYDKDAQVDVIAVVKECGDLQQIISKTTQKAVGIHMRSMRFPSFFLLTLGAG